MKTRRQRSYSLSSIGSAETYNDPYESDGSMTSTWYEGSPRSRSRWSSVTSAGNDSYYDDLSLDPPVKERRYRQRSPPPAEIKTTDGLTRVVHSTLAKLRRRDGCPIGILRQEIKDIYGFALAGTQNTRRLNTVLKNLTKYGKVVKTSKGYLLSDGSSTELRRRRHHRHHHRRRRRRRRRRGRRHRKHHKRRRRRGRHHRRRRSKSPRRGKRRRRHRRHRRHRKKRHHKHRPLTIVPMSKASNSILSAPSKGEVIPKPPIEKACRKTKASLNMSRPPIITRAAKRRRGIANLPPSTSSAKCTPGGSISPPLPSRNHSRAPSHASSRPSRPSRRSSRNASRNLSRNDSPSRPGFDPSETPTRGSRRGSARASARNSARNSPGHHLISDLEDFDL